MADRVELEQADRVSNVSEPEEDFSITYMRSQTSYFHRFIRFKNVEVDRQVLLENAIERYLVALEDGDNNIQLRTQSSCRHRETILYSTLQEDTAKHISQAQELDYGSIPTPQFPRENH